MKKTALFGITFLFFFGCASKQPEVKPIKEYSLYNYLYEKVEDEAVRKVDKIEEKDTTILNVPKYIKVYRGSYKDENGNVVSGGIELIKIDNGEPNTNF